MKIRAKLRITLLISLATALGLATVLIRTQYATRQAIHRMKQTDAIVNGVFDLRILSGDYAAYGVERARNQWTIRYESITRLLAEAATDPEIDPQIVARMNRNREALGRTFRRLQAATEGTQASASDAQFRARLMAQVDVVLLALISDSDRLFETLYRRLANRQRTAAAFAACSSLVLLSLLALIAITINRTALRPLHRLEQGARIIGCGNLDHRIGLNTDDEVGDLARALDQMAGDLKTTMASRDDLAREVTTRRKTEKQLEATLARLARSNEELEQFAYIASHDLQEPLRKIIAFDDLLHREAKDSLSPDAQDYMARIDAAVKRMQTLINDILLLSRVTTRGQPFVPVDTNKVLQEVLSDLGPRIEDTRGTVQTEALPTIDGDPTQIRQLLQNLIGNALKFHKPDAPPVVRVFSREHQPLPSEAPPSPGDGLCDICVQDDGIGFDEKYLDKIFGIFQRLHSRDQYGGSGIGLAVCRKIAVRHGGSITAQSKPGAGATFIVTLPLRQPAPEQQQETGSHADG